MMRQSLLIAAVAASVFLSASAEAPYAFRERMESVHEKDRRDPAAKCAADEYELKDGVRAVNADFADYLVTSMGVAAMAVPGGEIAVAVDSSFREREYEISVSEKGVAIRGRDERAIAQAFYRLEDRMNLRRGPFLRYGTERRRMRFEARMTHSGYAISEFPEAHLEQMAHAGMSAIILFVEGIDKIEGMRAADVNRIIRRAKAHGLDTYLYSCVTTFCHPDDGDKPFDEAFGPMAKHYPEAKGLFIVGESCQFPSKDPRVQPRTWSMKKKDPRPEDKRPLAGWFPCSDYPDWLRAVQRAIGKYSSDMKTIFWTYNWGWADEASRLALVDALPPETILQATFEMFERQKKPNGIEAPTADYSLSVIGPGRYFASEAAAAKKRGLKLFTQANAGGRTWDFGTAPYEPFPQRWHRRWSALVKANEDWNLAGIMENHHYGWSPTFLAELEKEAYTEGGMPFDEHLRAIAARDFGEANADAAIAAWQRWSDTMENYVATDLNQYGPFRCGPAYPYTPGRGKIDGKDFPVPPQSLVGAGFIRMNYINRGFVPELQKEDSSPEYMEKEVELLGRMIADFDAGADAFAAMPGPKARRMAVLGRYLARVCSTALNVKRGWIADARGDETGILAAAKAEYANALATLPLVEEDSHLGWELIMDYVGGPDQIRWKLDLMKKLYGESALR